MAIRTPAAPARPLFYPEEDDDEEANVSETDEHSTQFMELFGTLRAFFQDRPDVWVGGDNFVYYVEGDITKRISPDVFVVFGVRSRSHRARGSFKIWEEGAPPTVVFELASPKTYRRDQREKQALYAEIGVAEYYLFDPVGNLLKPPLQGYLLDSGRYIPRIGLELDSPALGLRLIVRDGWLRLLNPATGDILPTVEEQAAALAVRDAEIARLQAELARLRSST